MKKKDEYSCAWCHIPFALSEHVAFIKFNKHHEVKSYHRDTCYKKAYKASQNLRAEKYA